MLTTPNTGNVNITVEDRKSLAGGNPDGPDYRVEAVDFRPLTTAVSCQASRLKSDGPAPAAISFNIHQWQGHAEMRKVSLYPSKCEDTVAVSFETKNDGVVTTTNIHLPIAAVDAMRAAITTYDGRS
jgi:hypothetical protein